MLGQLVELSGSRWRKQPPLDDPVPLQLAQPEAQNVGRDPGQALAEIREPLGPERELADDEQRPALTDEIECASDAAVLVVCPFGNHFVKENFIVAFHKHSG
jgi:hypothetical protein